MKFKSIIVINLIILNMLIAGWNFDLKAKNIENEMNSTPISRSNIRFSDKDFNWSEMEIISEPILGGNININNSTWPAIAVDNDKIYVVWNDQTNISNSGDDSDIFYRYFDGISWSEIQVISEPEQNRNLNTDGSDAPDIAVENGKIFVVWMDTNDTNGAGTDWDIFYRCNLTGSGWEPIQVISEPIMDINNNINTSGIPRIAIENNKVYVVWYDYTDMDNSGGDGDIFYRCNLTGSIWEPIQIISEPVSGYNINIGSSVAPDIAVENGKIYIVWDDSNDTNGAKTDTDIFYICNLTGTAWEDVQVISEPVLGQNFNIDFSFIPKIAVEDGKIHVVWCDYSNTTGAGSDIDIFYRCNLTGNNWEDIQVISEPVIDQNFNIGRSDYPEIIIEHNMVSVVWYDNNNTNGAGTDFDIFYTCNFNNSRWEPVQVISEPVKNKNLNTLDSERSDIGIELGKIYIVWQDENNTNGAGNDWDIFYRWGESPFSSLILGFPSVTPTSGYTNTDFNFTVSYIHYDNIAPTEIIVNISGIEYRMLEVNLGDINYKDGKEYFFNLKNLDIGVHNYKFGASDGINITLSILRNNPIVYNTPPNIITEDNLTAFEDVYYEVDYDYEDIDHINIGQPAFWNFSSNASWLEFNLTTATLNGTPTNDDVGKYWVNISVFDTIDIDFINFTLTVLNINDPPIITTNNIEIIYEDEYYQVDYEAVDIDTPQNNLLWSLNTNSTWLSFNTITGVLNGTPTNDDVDEYFVSISVSDNEYVNYSNFTLKVINVNDPPKIITKPNTTALEDAFYEKNYQAFDVDNAQHELTWKILTNAKWLNYDTLQPVINGTPTNDDVGEYWVNISVKDFEYLDYSNFTLTVVNTNDPPRIITGDKTSITVGELYSVNYEAEDIDPPPITLTWSLKTNASSWLTIDKITGWLNGIPAKDDAGIYWVNVSVTDDEDGWDFHNFTLCVLKQPTKENNPPRLFNRTITPLKGNIKTKFTFSVQYLDPESESPEFIQLVIDNSVYNLLILPNQNTSNGTYFTSIYLTEGQHIYYFMASDGIDIVRTDNLTSPDVKGSTEVPQESTSWYWVVLIVVIIIIILLTFIFIINKRKAAKIPVLRAELMKAAPPHLALPGEISKPEPGAALPSQATVLDQLPTPQAQAQQAVPGTGESIPEQLPPQQAPITPQYQLPKATLTKEQQLGLLRERFLRSEVTEETYNRLRAELEGKSEEDISGTEIKVEIKESQTKPNGTLTSQPGRLPQVLPKINNVDPEHPPLTEKKQDVTGKDNSEQ